jgi:hypothetical protein
VNKAIKMKKKPKKRPGRATGGLLVWLVRFFTDLIKTLREAWHREQGRLSTGGGGGGGGGGGSTPAGRPAPAPPGRPGGPASSGPRVDGTRVGPHGAPGQAIHGQGNGRSWPGSPGATTNRFEDPDLFEDDDLDEVDEESTDDGQDDGASEQSDDAGHGSNPGTDAGDGGGEMGGDGSGGAA